MTDIKKIDFDFIEAYIKKVGVFIADIIEKRGISKKSISEAIDMSTNTINNCCRGKNPNIKTVLAIGSAINLTAIEIFSFTEGIEIAEEDDKIDINDDLIDLESLHTNEIKDEDLNIEDVDLEETIITTNLIPNIFDD